MTRDWITSPSPREPIPIRDPFEERPWWTDSYESTFLDYPGPGENTRPDVHAATFACRCQCGCKNSATNGSYCLNCDPGGRQ